MFTEIEAAIEEAQFLANTTGIRRHLVRTGNKMIRVVVSSQVGLMVVLESFYPVKGGAIHE